MKSLKNNLQRNPLLFLLSLLAIVFLSACNQDDDNSPTLDEEEVAALMEGALFAESEGLSAEASAAVEIAERSIENNDIPCGMTFDSSLTRTYNTSRITASYTTSWNWTLTCDVQQRLVKLDFSRTANGSYETPRMASDDAASSNWQVSNFLQGTNYILNGTYTREGSQTSKIRNRNNFTSDLRIDVANLNVSKTTGQIQSGNASFTLTGNGSGGSQIGFSGEIVFLGNSRATVTINGMTYEIDWSA